MGRLSSANCGTASNLTMTFDPIGNVCKAATAGTSFCKPYDVYNRIVGVNYDADGDLLTDPVSGAANAFDAEGRPTTFINQAVVYDALGRAVEGAGQEFVYAPGGGKMAVMNGQALIRADIPLPGGAEAAYTAGGFAYYRHTDLLGSSRMATTYAGGLYSSTAFAAYGEPLFEAGTKDRSFTGQKQDIASSAGATDANGQYDFLAREYSPTQSRWWTPDPAGLAAVDPDDPESWNRYAYVDNLPLSETDEYGCAGCPKGSHPATDRDAEKYLATAETYVGKKIGHADSSHYAPNHIDCSGLVMCAVAGQAYINQIHGVLSYLGIDFTTRNLDSWSVPGTGARGDIVYFARPGHVAFVTKPEVGGVGEMLGSQGHGPADGVKFGALAPWWGKAPDTSAPIFRRPCIKDPPAQPTGGTPFRGGWRISSIWSCSNEGCGVVGWGLWFDTGGIIPPGLISPFAF